jgi:hypothetical protein
MTSMIAEPQLIATAAADAEQISSAINAARAAAAGPTTGMVAAAQDEVSALAATFFNSYAQEYQAMIGQAAAFNGEFAQLLASAGSAYATAEAQAVGTLEALTGVGSVGGTGASPAANVAVLIMTGSGTATPGPTYIQNVVSRYLQGIAGNIVAVSTAEGLYPFTGVKDLTLDISLARGVTELKNAIALQIAPADGNSVAVLGYSQSSIIASMAMPQLLAQGYLPSQISFTLLGDPANPNGGLLSRFPGLSFPSLGVTFGTSTPSNDFPTTIYTLEYDGFADFPQYPIDVLADANALAGIVFIHGTYPTLDPARLAGAITLGQSGAPSMTTYKMIPTENLPLLAPLRIIPGIGNPLADLIQPDLKYLINWGYGDPNFGWSTSPADVPTPFGFLPPLGATTSLPPLLVSGAQVGVHDFATALSAEVPTSLPAISLPAAANALLATSSASGPFGLPTATDIGTSLKSANDAIVGGFTRDVSTAYATLLPTADIATAIAITLPSYDVNLFIDGITQAANGDPMGLVNAFGRPIAADVGLATLAGGFGIINFVNAADTIFTGTPNPGPF